MPPTRGRPRTARPRASRTRVFKKAEIGRWNTDTMSVVAFKEGDTVKDLLTRANIILNTGDEINDERGNTINPCDKAKETAYYVTENYKNG